MHAYKKCKQGTHYQIIRYIVWIKARAVSVERQNSEFMLHSTSNSYAVSSITHGCNICWHARWMTQKPEDGTVENELLHEGWVVHLLLAYTITVDMRSRNVPHNRMVTEN